MSQHLIFEGAELAGKSWLMSQVYNFLEPKYNENARVLDGCHWFNCDVGVFGTKYGKPLIKDYLRIFADLRAKNILAEKFHISDIVYNRLHRNIETNYYRVEKKLAKLDFKIIFITFPVDESIIKKRIADRLNIYPHYRRILRETKWYLKQQEEYKKEIEKSILEHIIIETNKLPDEKLTKKILKWLGEK